MSQDRYKMLEGISVIIYLVIHLYDIKSLQRSMVFNENCGLQNLYEMVRFCQVYFFNSFTHVNDFHFIYCDFLLYCFKCSLKENVVEVLSSDILLSLCKTAMVFFILLLFKYLLFFLEK